MGPGMEEMVSYCSGYQDLHSRKVRIWLVVPQLRHSIIENGESKSRRDLPDFLKWMKWRNSSIFAYEVSNN
jgi:hypothetical protein